MKHAKERMTILLIVGKLLIIKLVIFAIEIVILMKKGFVFQINIVKNPLIKHALNALRDII